MPTSARSNVNGMALPVLPVGVSAEAPLHAALYARDGAIGAVFHVHSLAATLASQRWLAAGFFALEGYEMLKALAGIATHEARVTLPVMKRAQRATSTPWAGSD